MILEINQSNVNQINQLLLDESVRMVKLTDNVTIYDSIVLQRRTGKVFVFDLQGHDIFLKDALDDSKYNQEIPVFIYDAINQADAEIDIQTKMKFCNGSIYGGSEAFFIESGFGLIIENFNLYFQKTAILLRFCLNTTIDNVNITKPISNGLILDTGSGNWPGGTFANSQSNVTTVSNVRVYNRPDCDGWSFINIGNNGVIFNNITSEGQDNEGAFFFDAGQNPWVKLCTINNIWIENTPRRSGVRTNAYANLAINGLLNQLPMTVLEVEREGCKVVIDNCPYVATGSYALIHPKCDINLKNSTNEMYNENFWHRPDGSVGFPFFWRSESAYRVAVTDVEVGGEDGNTDEVDIDSWTALERITEFPLAEIEPFGAVVKVNALNWGGALWGLGNRVRPQNFLYIDSVGTTNGVLHLMAFGSGQYFSTKSNNDFFAAGLEKNTDHLVYITFDGVRYTCGLYGGQSKVYDPNITFTDNGFDVVTIGNYVWPNRPTGTDNFDGTSEGYFKLGADLQDCLDVCEFIKE